MAFVLIPNPSFILEVVPKPTKRIGKWTLPLFLERAREIHGDKYDYSQITSEHIRGQKSYIPIRCIRCSYRWSPTIDGHINGRTECVNCKGKALWTLERFLARALEIH